ncbi:hypothetical protein HID58_069695 [Brassica napus]|uniref:Uncharacterized protein n=1 Tax=Brassica napus TaxID=3708 RepID=A0ABQ7YWL4_BRANA|nr:hypothetical protein HID58_069695 [Brassica napus]
MMGHWTDLFGPGSERRRLREAGFTEQRHLPLSTVEGSRAGAF